MGSKETVTYSGGGIGFLVWIALIILKATGHIAMGWFWVFTSIIWVPLGITIFVLIVEGIVVLIAFAVGADI